MLGASTNHKKYEINIQFKNPLVQRTHYISDVCYSFWVCSKSRPSI